MLVDRMITILNTERVISGAYSKKNVEVRFFVDSQGTDAVYTSKTAQTEWIEINDVYRSPRLNKNADITIDIRTAQGNILYVYPKKKIYNFLNYSNFYESMETCNLSFYPIWNDEYSNENYFKILTSEGVKKPEIELCHIDANVKQLLKDYQ